MNAGSYGAAAVVPALTRVNAAHLAAEAGRAPLTLHIAVNAAHLAAEAGRAALTLHIAVNAAHLAPEASRAALTLHIAVNAAHLAAEAGRTALTCAAARRVHPSMPPFAGRATALRFQPPVPRAPRSGMAATTPFA